MNEIIRIIILCKQYPPITLPLVEDLGYDGMTKFRDQLLLGIEPEGYIENVHTKSPQES